MPPSPPIRASRTRAVTNALWSALTRNSGSRSTGNFLTPDGAHGAPAEKPFGELQLPRSCSAHAYQPGITFVRLISTTIPPSRCEAVTAPCAAEPPTGRNCATYAGPRTVFPNDDGRGSSTSGIERGSLGSVLLPLVHAASTGTASETTRRRMGWGERAARE